MVRATCPLLVGWTGKRSMTRHTESQGNREKTARKQQGAARQTKRRRKGCAVLTSSRFDRDTDRGPRLRAGMPLAVIAEIGPGRGIVRAIALFAIGSCITAARYDGYGGIVVVVARLVVVAIGGVVIG